jgi:hypothetical protein
MIERGEVMVIQIRSYYLLKQIEEYGNTVYQIIFKKFKILCNLSWSHSLKTIPPTSQNHDNYLPTITGTGSLNYRYFTILLVPVPTSVVVK